MEVPVLKLNKMLAETAKKNGTSLHLSIGSAPMVRAEGKLEPLESEGMVDLALINSLLNSFVTPEEVDIIKEKKEITVVSDFQGGLRFKINIFYQQGLPAVSFHLIPQGVRNFSELPVAKVLEPYLDSSSGLLVVAGTNGAGKTTTIASFLEEINRTRRKYIATLENPIEYRFTAQKSIISQRQIKRDVNTAAEGLEYFSEEDIDIIFVGDLKEEFEQAIPLVMDLAAGNSFVILEVNAKDSASAIEKILEAAAMTRTAESARYNLADVLAGVLAQKLLPRRGGGQVLAYEMLIANAAVKSLVRENKLMQIESIIQTSKDEGMVSMEKTISEYGRTGEIAQDNLSVPAGNY